MSSMKLITTTIGAFATCGLLLILPACETEPDASECLTVDYECPEGEVECASLEEEGCKEYTFDDGEACAQTILCGVPVEGDDDDSE